MLISTEIGSIANIVGEEKAVELVGKAGFDAWDFSMFKMGAYDWTNKCLKNIDHPLAVTNIWLLRVSSSVSVRNTVFTVINPTLLFPCTAKRYATDAKEP